MNQVNIGKFIKELRKEKNMTQKELAEKLGVTANAVGNWENGRRMPDYSLLNDLCSILDTNINELLSGERLKENNYKIKYDENLENILKEYYKIKKQRKVIKNILIVVIAIFLTIILRGLILLEVISLNFLIPYKNITGIENYDKNYFIEKYGGDLDSNLAIFPDDISNMISPEFFSSFKTSLFDTDGYIILNTKYDYNDFYKEIERIKNINITISDCKNSEIVKYIQYDENIYKLPAYITMDGFLSTYEYALTDNDNLSITYIYLTYPDVNNKTYETYLKKDINEYSNNNNLENYSIYNHSFDNEKSFYSYLDCN